MAKHDEINPDEALREAEERQVGVSLPIQISHRLDRLVALAESGGLRVYRKDLVAALVLAAAEDPDELTELLLRFGKAKNRDAMADDERGAEVLRLERPKPGRRPRRS